MVMQNAPRTSFLVLLPCLCALALLACSSTAAERTLTLFNGKDVTGWRKPTGTWSVVKGVALEPADPKKFIVTPGQGVALNSADSHTTDLITEPEFGDMQAHIE